VLAPPGGAVAGVDVAGGAPGTRETDLLDPRNAVERLHAVVLTGGSAVATLVKVLSSAMATKYRSTADLHRRAPRLR
jgi:L-aminopeptidase/D-esterase-like protein